MTQAVYVGQPGRRYAFYSIAKDNAGNVENAPATADATTNVVASTVVGRGIFYNNSALDGNNAAANDADDAAIARNPDGTAKQALLPGQKATFANYTSYSKGINGIMIDISHVGTLSAGDFIFKVGNTNDPSTWVAAPAPLGITVRSGAGQNRSDRVEIVWADGAIKKQWLQITVNANGNTGLLTNDVFYFGNAVGDSGNSTTDAAVNTADALGARGHGTPGAAVTNVWDYNRDGKVDAADVTVAQQNGTAGSAVLQLITVPADPAAVKAAVTAVPNPGFGSYLTPKRTVSPTVGVASDAKAPNGTGSAKSSYKKTFFHVAKPRVIVPVAAVANGSAKRKSVFSSIRLHANMKFKKHADGKHG